MKSFLTAKSQSRFNKTFEKVVVRCISSWCFSLILAVFYSMKNITDITFFNSVSTIMLLMFFSVAFVTFSVVSRILKKINTDAIFLGVLVPIYVFTCVISSNNVYLCLGLLIPAGLCLYYLIKKFGDSVSSYPLSKRTVKIHVLILILIIFTVVGGLTTLKYLTFCTPNYDFGLFSQMFYYMKETFLPYCTSERDELLSHFAVHVSPIFYLILPVYMIFPSPATLQLSQAFLLASAVIPVYLLCRHYHLSNKVTLLVAIMTAFFPALSGGAFYDVHENVFLTPLILWMLYFLEKEKYIPAYLFMLLTFAVKEDAAMYVMFIALYFIFSGRKIKHGTIMLVSAVVYFCVALYLLDKYGTGVMTNRFDNFYDSKDNSGLLTVVVNVLKNPAYVVTQCLTEEKILFSLQMLLPLGLLPLMNKKWSQFILLGPFILVNLMPNYAYQHSIYFQYVYGVMALFFYLSIMNIAQIKSETKRYVVPMAALFSVIIFVSAIFPKVTYLENMISNREEYIQIRSSLDLVPDDASVVASTFYLPYLSQRKEIYEVEYTKHTGEYLVLDLRYDPGKKEMKEVNADQYQLISYKENLIAVYKKLP